MTKKTKNSSQFKHLLVADVDLRLDEKIEAARKRYRPHIKSRNAFIIELILHGIEKLKDKSLMSLH